MAKLNLELIFSNIQEAKDELEKLGKEIKADSEFDESQLGLSLAHAYHHINFAWNTRNQTDDECKKLKDDDFKRFSKFPVDIEKYGLLGK